MGELRTRDFVGLLGEFKTYQSICNPDGREPTSEQVQAAFARSRRLQERIQEMARDEGHICTGGAPIQTMNPKQA